MRIAVLVAVVAALVGCGAGSSASTAASTDLRITVWPQGRDGNASKQWTLRCNPAAGSLPRAATACQKLAAMTLPFKPIPGTAVCTEIYGGPQQAQIVGTHRGKPVRVTLAARNGCEISRAKKLGFLVPGFGTSASA